MSARSEFFAIREIKTQLLLPRAHGSATTLDRQFGDAGPPHLFTHRHFAEASLKRWLPHNGRGADEVAIIPVLLIVNPKAGVWQ